MAAEGMELLPLVMEESVRLGSLFRDNIPGRDALLEFLEYNNWFGIEHSVADGNIHIMTAEPMKKPLKLWLLAYGKSRSEKIHLMLKAYDGVYPKTCHMLRCFIEEKECWEASVAWKLVDFLLYTLTGEICEYNDEELEQLLKAANSELPIAGMKFLSEFLHRSEDGRQLTDWNYSFQSRQLVKSEKSAYSLNQFSIMAYTIFNEEAWAELGLIQKATGKKRYADLWLYTALHFVCAIRKSDMKRLPVPALPYSSEEVRNRIHAGIYTPEESKGVVREMLFRMRMKPIRPGKTQRHSGIPDLKLFIPESLMEPLGVIMSLSVSFHNVGDPFVSTNFSIPDIQKFFGKEFANSVGNRNFLSRRANKSYLQGIEAAADSSDCANAKGYMLAALARCHKGGIGKLPEITDVYLRDATFTGYSPEFILREMFERGIFGFLPALLLETYAGKDYLRLDVSAQTQLIKAIGLEAYQLENIVDTVMYSFQRASKIVRGLLLDQCREPKRLESLLQSIASGAAPSKQSEFLCLRTAAGYPCSFPERRSCIGCGYEIYTKSAVHLLMKEYVRQSRRKAQTDESNAKRITTIMEKGMIPAIAEVLSSIPMLYPDAEMESIMNIMERGVRDADCT